MPLDILPDSRCRDRKESKRITITSPRGNVISCNMIPVFCASCGRPMGWAPEKMMTHAFITCTPCDEKYGVIAGLMHDPNEVFYQRVAEAQAENAALTTLEGMRKALDDPNSPIAKIARDWRAANSKEL